MEIFESALGFIGDWYLVPLIFIYIGVISTILIENRNPTKTISWILVIVFLPLIGLILYYLFGQKFSKVKKMKEINQLQYEKINDELEYYEKLINSQMLTIQHEIGDLSRVFKFLKNERLSVPSLNNQVRLLINGEEKFKYLIESLENAKQSIHLEYYIFDLDEIGTKVLDILERKYNEGLSVRLIIDSFGSPKMARYLRKNTDIHFEWQAFLPVTFASLANSNYRNHRKIAVIDGEVGYVGGINISDKYINDVKEDRGYWRDTAVRIEGDAVGLLQIIFWNSWNQTDGKPFLLGEKYLKKLYQDDPTHNTAVSFATSNPGSKGPFNMEAILISLGEANRKIQLVTPYYIPSEELETALMVAASAGIEVELILPKKGDSYIVQHATFSYLKPLLERGVKVYLYEKGFIHAKTINVDDKIAYVGTVNLDTRSFYINYEIAAIVSDEQFCREMDKQFEIDKQNSYLLTMEGWYQRKKWKRGIDSLCRLLAPLL